MSLPAVGQKIKYFPRRDLENTHLTVSAKVTAIVSSEDPVLVDLDVEDIEGNETGTETSSSSAVRRVTSVPFVVGGMSHPTTGHYCSV